MESRCHGIMQSSNIWNNFDDNNEIDCMKEEINKTYNVEHVIKSECQVVLKRLNIKVKTEGHEEIIHLPNKYEYLKLIKKNKFFTPKKRFKRDEMKMKNKEKEHSEEHDMQHDPKRTKGYKYKTNRKRFSFSIRKLNEIQGNIKKKYFKVMCSMHSKENFTCNLCTQTFLNYKVLRAHLFFHIGNKQFHCKTCNQKFWWEFLLRTHKKEHNNEKQIEINRKVGVQSSSKYLLEPLEQWKPFQCDICDKRVMTMSRLKMHHKTHLSYICKICKKEFKWECHLRRHLVTHSEDRPFKCDICNKGFKTRKALKAHNETHSDEYKYSCDICGRSFKTKSCLANHKLIHSDKNSYFCEICRTSFKTRRSLKSHVETHSDKYNYSCKICKRCFKTRNSLYTHKLVHSEIRKFFCEICKKSFKHKNTLVRHRFVQHENT